MVMIVPEHTPTNTLIYITHGTASEEEKQTNKKGLKTDSYANRRRPISQWVGEAGTQGNHKPQPQHHNWAGSQNSDLP